MKRPKGKRTYTDAWDLTKDTLDYTKDTAYGKELAKACGYNVTTLKKASKKRIDQAGGSLTVDWL